MVPFESGHLTVTVGVAGVVFEVVVVAKPVLVMPVFVDEVPVTVAGLGTVELARYTESPSGPPQI